MGHHLQAVAHLDKSLQEKVLATAAKIVQVRPFIFLRATKTHSKNCPPNDVRLFCTVQKRFLADKELDRKLQHQILQAGRGGSRGRLRRG